MELLEKCKYSCNLKIYQFKINKMYLNVNLGIIVFLLLTLNKFVCWEPVDLWWESPIFRNTICETNKQKLKIYQTMNNFFHFF